MRRAPRRRARRSALLALDLALLAAWLVAGVAIGRRALDYAELRAQRRELVGEAQRLYDALALYYSRHRAFPAAYAEPGFDLATLEPLVRRGYYDRPLAPRLRDGRLDGYDSPDDRGPNQEFWLEMTSAHDPPLRIVVARSDDAPTAGGTWIDGVVTVRAGRLEPHR
jgi:hypothetical protein